MRRILCICSVVLCVAVAGGEVYGQPPPIPWPVVSPYEQTIALGEAASFDGSESYDYQTSIAEYSWDFEADSVYDYTETSASAPDGNFDGKTTHTYSSAGKFHVWLKVTDADPSPGPYSDKDHQWVTVRVELEVTAHSYSSVSLSWDNANHGQFTWYKLYVDTSAGVDGSDTLVAEITNQATTTYTVNDLEVGETYYFAVLVSTNDTVWSNEVSQTIDEGTSIRFLYDDAGNRTRVRLTRDGASSWDTWTTLTTMWALPNGGGRL